MLGRLSFISATVSVTPSPTMPSSKVCPGPTMSGVRTSFEFGVKLRFQLFFGQVDPVADHAREDHFKRGALAHRRHARHLLGRIDRRDLGLRREVERDAHDVGIFDIEQSFGIQIVGIAAQAAPDDLLAQKLGAEGANAEDMGDGVGVPSLGQHGDGHDAAHLFAKSPFLADRIHDFAQQVGVGEFPDFARAGALRDLTLVLLDLKGGGAPEIVVERFAGFKLLAVDQQRVGTGKAISVLVEIAEQRKMAVVDGAQFLAVLGDGPLPAGNPFIDKFRCGGVIADDDEHRRRVDAGLLPFLESLCVVVVESDKRGL